MNLLGELGRLPQKPLHVDLRFSALLPHVGSHSIRFKSLCVLRVLTKVMQ